MVKVVFVIADKHFQDLELLQTEDVLKSKRIGCVIASKSKGMHTGKFGTVVESALLLSEITDDYDGIIFIGGQGAAQYFLDKEAFDAARRFAKNKKVVAAICIAPTILANAGLLAGKRATCFPSERVHLDAKDAVYTGEHVARDGNIITADGPDSSKAFGEEIARALGK